MQWYAAAILGCTLYGVYDGLRTHQLISSTIVGFLVGLIVCVVGALVVWFAANFVNGHRVSRGWLETSSFG
jgi:hypothetical protein